MSQQYAPPVDQIPKRKHRKWPWMVGAVALIVVGAAVANNGSNASYDPTSVASSSAQSSAANSNVKITKFSTDKSIGVTTIEGTFQNDGSEKSYVQIEGVVLDKDGNQVDTFLANTTNLAANKLWKWKASAMVSSNDAAKAQIKNVSSD